MENLGHLTGMLDRDQRTAKLRFFSDKQVARTYIFPEKAVNESNAIPKSIISRHRSFCHTRTKSLNSSYLMWRNGYLLKSFHRLTNVLIVGVYLTLVTLPCTSSAPTKKMSERMKSREEWIDPCNYSNNSEENSSQYVDNDSDFLTAAVQQAQRALGEAENFKDTFANQTFGMPFKAFQDFFPSETTWLNIKIPTSLEKNMTREQVDKVILDVYGYLQKVAVGLEQIVWDQEDNQGQFEKNFTLAKDLLKGVLCELQMALITRKIEIKENVTRDVMPKGDRELNATERISRDFKIFREYMSVLNYIIEVFSSFPKE